MTKKKRTHATWTLSCGYASKWLRRTSFLADASVALDCELRPLCGPSNKIDSHFKCDRVSCFVPSSWHTERQLQQLPHKAKNTHNILWHTRLTQGSRASTRQLNASWSLSWPLLELVFQNKPYKLWPAKGQSSHTESEKTNGCEKGTLKTATSKWNTQHKLW